MSQQSSHRDDVTVSKLHCPKTLYYPGAAQKTLDFDIHQTKCNALTPQ